MYEFISPYIPQICFGMQLLPKEEDLPVRYELWKMEDLPEQENKRSISKSNKK